MMDAQRVAARGVEVVHRDDSLLVLFKPSGLPTTSPRPTEHTLVMAAHALDPKAPRLHPSSRLDAEVSGLVTFARTEAATRYLLQAREQGLYRRLYVALVARAPAVVAGEIDAPIGLDPRDARKRRVVQVAVQVRARAPAARTAQTRYQVVCGTEQAALLALMPRTGRTHQLRVHLAHIGSPILGDRPYGGAARVVLEDGAVLGARRVMLHCLAIELPALRGAGFDEPARSLRSWPPTDFERLSAAATMRPLREVLVALAPT